MKAAASVVLLQIFFVFGTVVNRGGYDEIVIAISEDVPQPMDCQSFLGRVERAFSDASNALHAATDRRVFFRSVTVLLPTSWNDCSKPVEASSGESFNSAEFRIDVSSPLFGDSVYTQQSKGCGKRGDFVKIPVRFFDDAENVYGSKGKALLHEWAKVRYGVFDEFGFPGDNLYPTFYERKDEFVHTGCSNEPIKGDTTCNPAVRDDCHLVPSGDNSKVTSSLMYLHYLDNVSQFCSNSTHNRFAPTKQNVLCEGASARDVIFSNSDLLNSTVPVNTTRTTFSYKKTAKTRFVLAIDVSTDMGISDRYAFIRRAARRFILKDLPTGTDVGLVTFSDSSTNLTAGTVSLNDDASRKNLFNLLPYDPSSTSSKCILCALNKAIQVLEAGDGTAAGHSIIIITTPLSAQDSLGSIENTVDVAKQKKIRVSVISYTGTFDGHTFLTAETNGYQGFVRSEVLSNSDSNLGMLTQLGSELLAALSHQTTNAEQALSIPIVIHEKSSDTSSFIKGSFTLDKSSGLETLFAVYFYDLSRPGVSKLQLSFPNGTLSSSFSDEDLASSYITTLVPISQPGTWNYTIERDSASRQPHIVKVTTRQFATSEPKLSVRVYSSLELLEGDVTSDPIKLFVEVKFGRQPVLQARVVATISSPSGTSTVDLFDNGNSNPDLTGNDGLYSRHLTEITGNLASYTTSVVVTGDVGITYSVKDPLRKGVAVKGRPTRGLTTDPVNNRPCCGSTVGVPESRREYLPSFSRVVQGPLIKAKGYPSTLTIPPSRISDFRVEITRGTANWTFSWTAPGDDLDRGRAARYDLRYTYNIDDITEAQFDALRVWQVPFAPKVSGETEYLSGNFDAVEAGVPVFFVIKAVDFYANKGRISNVVEGFRVAPVVTTTPGGGGVAGESPLLSDAAIAGIVVGCALAVGLILLVIVICMKRRKEKETQYKKNLNGTSLKKEIIPEKVEIERKGSISVIPTSNEPIHWSASTLLQEHEKRHRNSGYEPAFSPKEYPDRYASMDSMQNAGFDTYNRGSRSPSEYKVPPPTMPKPKRPESQLGIPFAGSDLGSQSSLASDKKKRNITQV